MVGPAAKRAAVAQLQAVMSLSERRACSIVGADRKMIRYRPLECVDVEKRAEPLLRPLLCGLPYAARRLGHARPGLPPVRALLIRTPLGPCPLLRRRWPGFVSTTSQLLAKSDFSGSCISYRSSPSRRGPSTQRGFRPFRRPACCLSAIQTASAPGDHFSIPAEWVGLHVEPPPN